MWRELLDADCYPGYPEDSQPYPSCYAHRAGKLSLDRKSLHNQKEWPSCRSTFMKLPLRREGSYHSDLAEDNRQCTLGNGEMRPNIICQFLVSGRGWEVYRYLNDYCDYWNGDWGKQRKVHLKFYLLDSLSKQLFCELCRNFHGTWQYFKNTSECWIISCAEY